jgi:hypothetical protein
MEIKLVTAKEAAKLQITHDVLISEGHGAFGEPDNSYADAVFVGEKQVTLHGNEIVLYLEEQGRRTVLQVIRDYECSDKLLSIFAPELLEKRMQERYKRYWELQKELGITT